MKRVLWIFILLIGLLLIPMFRRRSPVSGRWIVGAVGIDRQAGQWTVSAQLLTDEKTVVQLSGDTVADAVSTAVKATGQGLELRQNQLFCIGETTAQTYDLANMTDYLVRSGNGRLTNDVIICRGTATELLNNTSAEQVHELTDRAVLFANGIRSRLLDIQRTLADSGDAIVPLVRIENERAMMDGAVLFVDGKWMTELSAEETVGLALLQNKAENATVTVSSSTAELQGPHRTVEVQPKGKNWCITVHLQARASIQEKTGVKPVDAASLEQEINQYMNSALQVTAKAYGADVCGLVDCIKKQMPFTTALSEGEWKQHLKNSEYLVETSIEITETGLR